MTSAKNKKLYINPSLGLAFWVAQVVDEMTCEVFGLKDDCRGMYTRKTVVMSRKYHTLDGTELTPMTEERPWPKYLMRSNSTRPGAWDAVFCVDEADE